MSDLYQLVLLRHAKAEPGGSLADHLRPLALTGRTQAGQVGGTLHASGFVPDRVLVSSAVRTRQTWDLVRGPLDVPAELATITDEIYDAGVRSLLDLVNGIDDQVRRLLVVGHEPTMSQTAAILAGPDSDAAALARVQIGVPTATYSVLSSERPWAQWAPHAVDLHRVVSPA